MQLTVEQRVHMVTKFLETQDYDAVIDSFVRQFPDRAPPSNMTIYRNVPQSQQRDRSGSPRTLRTPENIELVREAFTTNPSFSTRRNNLDLSQSCLRAAE